MWHRRLVELYSITGINKDMIEITVQFVRPGLFMCLLHLPFMFRFICVQYLHRISSLFLQSVVVSDVF